MCICTSNGGSDRTKCCKTRLSHSISSYFPNTSLEETVDSQLLSVYCSCRWSWGWSYSLAAQMSHWGGAPDGECWFSRYLFSSSNSLQTGHLSDTTNLLLWDKKRFFSLRQINNLLVKKYLNDFIFFFNLALMLQGALKSKIFSFSLSEWKLSYLYCANV